MRYQIALGKRSQADHWRNLAIYWMVSSKARERLEWIIFYHDVANQNVSTTAAYFGISRKTLHKWLKRFDPQRIQSLEEQKRRPVHLRTWEVTSIQEQRIKTLREKYLMYGKVKLKVLYEKQYSEPISTWKIERVIRKHHLYPNPEEYKKRQKRRQRRNRTPRLRIHNLETDKFPAGTLWHTDTILLWWYGQYKVIFTAIEDKTKLGYARVYPTHSSRNAADFLKRLMLLADCQIMVIHSDNGSEFAGEFEKACQQLGIEQVYSRIKQPKDNPDLERFNRTLQEEWLAFSEVGLDEIKEANQDLTEWLIEYNFHRPHQSLDYQTPIEYAHHHYFNVLPMYPARTNSCRLCYNYRSLF